MNGSFAMQKKVAVALVASFFVALCSAAVSQAVTVTAKNSPEPNEENLLLNKIGRASCRERV